MKDIGMSPDYRSGVNDTIECHVCKRQMPASVVDYCSGCGEATCIECVGEDLVTAVICVECACGD